MEGEKIRSILSSNGCVISSILPFDVVSEELWGSIIADPLLPQEAAMAGRMHLRRRREFSAGRMVARRATQRLGISPLPLLKGQHGEPLWPEGIVGSITHCAHYCAAAVALGSDYRGIGIDAEPHQPLPEEVRPHVLHPREIAWIASVSSKHIAWDTLIFSAKEAFYKLWFPLTKIWCEFNEAYIQINVNNRSFSISLQDNSMMQNLLGCESIFGKFTISGGIILTVFVVNSR